SCRFARIECRLVVGCRSHSKISLSDVYPYNCLVAFRDGVCSLYLKRDEQVELFLGLVIPQLGSTNAGTLLQESKMLGIARVGETDTPLKGEHAHMLICFETVVSPEVVGKGGRDVLGNFIESLVAFLGDTCLACFGILSRLCP